jgi:hypothetical protein
VHVAHITELDLLPCLHVPLTTQVSLLEGSHSSHQIEDKNQLLNSLCKSILKQANLVKTQHMHIHDRGAATEYISSFFFLCLATLSPLISFIHNITGKKRLYKKLLHHSEFKF